MKRNKLINNILVFVLLFFGFTAWFAFLMPWDRLPDPDAFYHAKMASLTWKNGPIQSFPWLDLTTLDKNFADQHYLLHVLQMPFVNHWGIQNGSRISSLVFAVLAMLAMTIVFYKLKLKPFWAWAFLLAISDPFSTRLILGKSSPLILAVFFVAIGLYLLYKPGSDSAEPGARSPETGSDNPMVRWFGPIVRGAKSVMSGSGLRASSLFGLSVCGVLFSLLHGGWVILIGAVGLLMVGKFTFDVAIEKQKILSAIKNAGWAQLIFTALGVAIGILVHPGRAQIATFLWTVVLKIGVGSPEGLAKGMEWNAADLGGGVGVFSIFGIVLLLCVAGLLFSRKTSLRVRRSNLPDDRGDEQSADRAGVDLSPRDDNENDELMGFMRPIIVLGPLLAALFAMTIKSVRFAEYFQPVLALWTAYLAQLVDWEHIFDKLKFDDKPTQPRDRQSNLLNRISRLKKFIADNLLPATVMFSSAICIFNHVWSSYNSLHNNGRFMDNQYQTPMRAISAQAQPGDRVYHSNWDEFPVLFAQDDRLRYVSGMDATFLYEASSTMALEYQDFVFKAASSTTDELWGFVHGKLDAKYVMVDQDRWQDLAQLIEKDARYQKLAQGDGGTAYKVSAGD